MARLSSARRSRSAAKQADRAGRLVAITDLPFTFQPTLMARPIQDQAIVTGLSFSANHAITALVQESMQTLAWYAMGADARRRGDETRWNRATLVTDGVAMAVGLGVQRLLGPRAREPVPRAAVRTGGYWLRTSGAAGAVIVGLTEALRRRDRGAVAPGAFAVAGAAVMGAELGRRLGRTRASAAGAVGLGGGAEDRAKALGVGLGAAGVLSLTAAAERRLASAFAAAAARVFPGSEALWQPVGHAVSLAGLGYGVKTLVERALSNIEHKETSFEAAFDIPPPVSLLSGSHESLVDFGTMSRQGRRYVWTVSTPAQIEAVMGEPAVAQPIRAYVGLESAADDDARVQLLVDELDRTGAFGRPWLLVMSPTGTGYLNYAAVGAFEMLTRGNCATASLQYAARPSVLSLDRVKHGRHVYRKLFAALRARLAEIPEHERPTVVLFGESLGSWASQDAFVDRGTQGLVEDGIDRAIWIGTPYFSKWKERVLYDDRPDVDRSLLAVCDSIDDWDALDDATRSRVRYVMVTHHNDGVALFGPPIAVQAPSWLTPGNGRAPEVPAAMTWMPNTTFFQVLVDMKNSANVVPGRFDDTGHDYRGALVPFFHAVLGLPATPDQLDALQRFLEARELQRTEWLRVHGDVGASMSARVVEELSREARAEGQDADARLIAVIQRIAARDFAALGGPETSPAQA